MNKRVITILVFVLTIACGGAYLYYSREISDPIIPSDPRDNITQVDVTPVQRKLFNLGPGINLAGAEFGLDTQEYDHSYPIDSIDYFAKKGIKLIRLPFAWERIQPTLGGPLAEEELNLLDTFLAEVKANNMFVILDLHNYARYEGNLIGDGYVRSDDLADVWTKLSEHYRDNEEVIAYGIMNEPHDTKGRWAGIAQDSIDAIRQIDTEIIIIVAGDNWSSASKWKESNENLAVNDPEDRLIYEAHAYFDESGEGRYTCTFDGCNISTDVGVENVQPFIDWLEENEAHGFIGEYGVPVNDERWVRVIDLFLEELQRHKIGSTIWAGGSEWGEYILSVEPTYSADGTAIDKPQMKVLLKYLNPISTD